MACPCLAACSGASLQPESSDVRLWLNVRARQSLLTQRSCRYVENLSKCADCYVFCYPNAGLPNAMGGYDQKGTEMAEEIRPFCEQKLVNALGGCCGTTPEHIAAIRYARQVLKAHLLEHQKRHGQCRVDSAQSGLPLDLLMPCLLCQKLCGIQNKAEEC